MKPMTAILMTAALLAAGSVSAETAPQNPASTPAKKMERCPPTTGSRLSQPPNPDGKCTSNLSGSRSYSSEEIERTGQTDLSRALPQIDPSLSTGRSGR